MFSAAISYEIVETFAKILYLFLIIKRCGFVCFKIIHLKENEISDLLN